MDAIFWIWSYHFDRSPGYLPFDKSGDWFYQTCEALGFCLAGTMVSLGEAAKLPGEVWTWRRAVIAILHHVYCQLESLLHHIWCIYIILYNYIIDIYRYICILLCQPTCIQFILIWQMLSVDAHQNWLLPDPHPPESPLNCSRKLIDAYRDLNTDLESWLLFGCQSNFI